MPLIVTVVTLLPSPSTVLVSSFLEENKTDVICKVRLKLFNHVLLIYPYKKKKDILITILVFVSVTGQVVKHGF